MLHKIALMTVVAFSLMESPASSQELATNSKKHIWSNVAYPPVDGQWGLDHKFFPTVHVNANRTGWEFELLTKGPKEQSNSTFDVPIPAECKIFLHSADGRIRRSIGDLVVVKDWNQESSEWTAKATCSFPWTRNDFDEAWIEFRTPKKVYYFELPYGFTRDPRSELCLPSPRGYPELVDSIRPIERGAQVIRWHHVEYDFGELEPGWQVLLWVSNPFDMRCTVLIRPLTDVRELPGHLKKIRVKLHQPERWDNVARQLLGRLYPKSPNLSRNSIESNFPRNPNDDRRWGEFELAVGDRKFTTVIPSSLFHYVHGVSDHYREAEKFRSNYGPQSLDPRIPFFRRGKEEIDAITRIGGASIFWFLLRNLEELQLKLQIKTDFKGNATAIQTLVTDNADLVILTRPLTTDEIVQFEKKFSQKPIPIQIAINRVGVFVHPENPISERGLSLAEADAIFSSTRKRGYKTDINRWGELGLTGEWRDQPIHRYSAWGGVTMIPINESTLFERQVINHGEYKEFQRRPQKNASLFNNWRADYNFGVDDKYGIGFGIVRDKFDLFKAVPLGQPPVFPTAGNCYCGDYPLTEDIYIVVSPNHLQRNGIRVTNPAIRELLKYVLSRQGQMEVSNKYLPLSYDLAKTSAGKVGVELAVRKSYWDVPPAIAGILSQTNSPENFELLVLELSQPVDVDHNSSRRATRLIKQWQRSKNFEPLIETVAFFDDSRSAVSAAVSLVSLGRDEYWKELRNYARHDHKRMRNWLIHELRRIHRAEAIEILMGLLGDGAEVSVGPRADIADEAHEALCSLTNQNFGKDESKWKEWWDSNGKTEFKITPVK